MIGYQLSIYSQSDLNQIVDLSRSPINTFKESCSRCHGTEGSAYGKGFAEMRDDSLKEIISMMMNGPAQLKPGQVDVDAMVAYNKSIRSKKPFAVALNSKSFFEEKTDNLLVSISAETKLSIKDKEVKVEETENGYRLFYDPKKIKNLKITLTRDNISASFNFPEKLWSE